MNHIPDKYEHLVRYYGHYSNRSRGTRRLAEQDTLATVVVVERTVDTRRRANWDRLIRHILHPQRTPDRPPAPSAVRIPPPFSTNARIERPFAMLDAS